MRVLVLFALLAGCAGVNQTLPPRIDDVTGETIVTLRKPVVLARQVPHLSTKARDYVYLGPVEIDRMGAQEFFLWVGMASTVDPAAANAQMLTPDHMDLVVDSEKLSFPLEAWDPEAEVAPYEVSVPVYRSLRARVTLEDLARIAHSHRLAVDLAELAEDKKVATASYRFWHGKMPAWERIAEDTSVGFSVEVFSRGAQSERR